MSDRIFAVCWLGVVGLAFWLISQFEVTFSYEPLGPKAYPNLIAGLMGVCAVLLLFKPDPHADWPRGPLLKKVAVMIATLFAYAMVFEWLGFIVATTLMTVCIGRLFDGTWKQCVLGGIGMAIALYLGFDKLLDVTLPVGSLLSGWK